MEELHNTYLVYVHTNTDSRSLFDCCPAPKQIESLVDPQRKFFQSPTRVLYAKNFKIANMYRTWACPVLNRCSNTYLPCSK